MWTNLIGNAVSRLNDDDDVDDGWEDDQDLVEDSSGHPPEEEDEEEEEEEAEEPIIPPVPGVGGGLRQLGRWTTRFLEHVTQPEDDYDDEYADATPNGWQDDDEDALLEEDTAMAAPPPPQEQQYPPADTTTDHHDEVEENVWQDDAFDLGDVDDNDANLSNEMDQVPSGMRESIHQAEVVLNQALEDFRQNPVSSTFTSDNELQEDAAEERQAIRAIQKEMRAMRPMVDHTPSLADPSRRSATTSIVTQWATEDGTRDSGPAGSKSGGDEDIFQDENEDAFGPVVDHVPRKPLPMVRTDSLAVQHAREDEQEDDDALFDETIATTDENGMTASVEEKTLLAPASSPAVVDHTPSVAHSRASRGESVDAILSVAGETTLVVGEDEEDEPADYGPVVDQIPQNATESAPVSGSVMPVVADDLSQDFKTDDAMDETVFAKGDNSTIDGTATDNAWDEDEVLDIDINDDESMKVNQPTSSTKVSRAPLGNGVPQGNMVDHTPYEDGEEGAGVTDPSIVVLAAEEDLTRDTGEPIDDEVFGEENELDFVPVVDHTPFDTSSRMTSTENSMRVEASGLEEDFQEDDAMDDTCFGDSVGPGLEKGSDGLEVEELKPPAVPNPNLVDHTPSQLDTPTTAKYTDPSVAVLASIDESVNEEGSEYGLVVDQLPHTPAAASATRSDSIIVQAADMGTVEDESMNDDDDEDNEDGDDGDTFGDEVPLGIGAAIRNAEDTLVDRVPVRPESRFGDASTMVAADPSEIMSEVDDLMAQEMEQNFGPVVDVTPLSESVTGRPSATESTMAFAPNSVASDDLEEDDGDETEGNDAWNRTILEEAAPNPQSGNDEPQQQEQLVDFLPGEDNSSRHEDVSIMGRTASSSVAIGGAQSLLQPEDPKEDDFGPVVDLTPAPLSDIPDSAASTATNVTASELRSLEKDDNIEGRSVDFDLEEKSEVVVDHIPNIREKQILDSLATVAQSQLTEEEEETASKFGPVVDHLPTPRTSVAPSRGGSTVDALATVSEVDSAGNQDNGWEDDLDLEDASAESDRTDRISTLGSVRRTQSTTSDHDRSVPSVRFDSTIRTATLKAPPPVTGQNHLYPPSHDSSTSGGWEEDDIASDAAYANGEAGRVFEHTMANAETPPATPYSRPVIARSVDESLLQPSMKECPSCANSKSTECPCVQRLLRITKGAGSLTGTLLTPDGDSLEVDFGEMLREEIAKRRLLEEEAAALRVLSADRKQKCEKLEEKETAIQSDVRRFQEENQKLRRTIEELKGEGELLRENSRTLSQEMSRSHASLDELRQAKEELAQREIAHLSEIEGLKKLLDQNRDKLTAEEDTARALMNSKQAVLEKESKCQQLEATVASLSARLDEVQTAASIASSESASQLKLLQDKLSYSENERAQAEKSLLESNSALEQARIEAEIQTRSFKTELDGRHAAIQAYEKRLTDLSARHQMEMQRQGDLLDAQAKDLKDLQDKLLSSEEARERLSTETERKLSMSEERITDLTNRLSSMTVERDSLQTSLFESRETASSLQRLVDEQGLKKVALDEKRDAEIVSLRNVIKKMQTELQARDHELAELRNRVREVEIEKENALADTEAAQSSVWDIQEQLDTANGFLADAESEVEGLKANLLHSEERYQQTQKAFEAAESQRKQLESRLMGLEKQLEAATADANRQASRVVDLEGQLHEQQNQRNRDVEHLHQQINSMSQQSNSGQQHLEVELQNAREWIELLQQEKNSLAEENEELLVQLGLLKGQMDEAASTIESFQADLDTLVMAVDAVNNGVEYNVNGSQVSDVTQSVIDALFSLQTRYAELEAEMTSFSSDREQELEKKIKELTLNSQSLIEEVSGLQEMQQHLESLQNACREKDDALQAKNFELQEAKSQKNAILAQLSSAHSSQANVNQEALQMVTSRAEQAEGALEHSRNELEETKAFVDKLQLQISSQQSSLEEMQASQESYNQSNSENLVQWQNKAQSLEEDLRQASSRVVELEKQLEDLKQVGSFSGTAGDDIHSLHAQIVSLATELEKSELQRADAMDRLMQERRANADSFRRLGESVQRFFSNVKHMT